MHMLAAFKDINIIVLVLAFPLVLAVLDHTLTPLGHKPVPNPGSMQL